MTFSLILWPAWHVWVTVFWTTWTWNLEWVSRIKNGVGQCAERLERGVNKSRKGGGQAPLLPRPHSWGRPHCPAGVKGKANTQISVHLAVFSGKSHEAQGVVAWFHCDSSLSCLSVTFLRCWFCSRGHKLLWPGSIETRLMSAVLSWPHIPWVDSEKCVRGVQTSMRSCVALQGWFLLWALMRCWMYVSDPGSMSLGVWYL